MHYSKMDRATSATGQSLPIDLARTTSALPPTAEVSLRRGKCRNGPGGDIELLPPAPGNRVTTYMRAALQARSRICSTSTRQSILGRKNGPHARTIHNAQSLSAPATVCGLVVYSRLYRPDQCELRRAHHARRSRHVGWHLRVRCRLVLLGLFHLRGAKQCGQACATRAEPSTSLLAATAVWRSPPRGRRLSTTAETAFAVADE